MWLCYVSYSMKHTVCGYLLRIAIRDDNWYFKVNDKLLFSFTMIYLISRTMKSGIVMQLSNEWRLLSSLTCIFSVWKSGEYFQFEVTSHGSRVENAGQKDLSLFSQYLFRSKGKNKCSERIESPKNWAKIWLSFPIEEFNGDDSDRFFMISTCVMLGMNVIPWRRGVS